jgi:hypothetical protein
MVKQFDLGVDDSNPAVRRRLETRLPDLLHGNNVRTHPTNCGVERTARGSCLPEFG